MKNIEIKTTQNVVLQYELADLRDRALAFLLDLICVVFGMTIISAVFAPVFSGSELGSAVFSVFIGCIFIFYSLAFEVLNNGQSIGKKALGIRVIKTAGGQATFSDYAARWVFRMIDIYFSLGCIASILVSSSAKAQRIGDIVANTAVVKLKPTMDLQLKELLTIRSRDSYQPQYLNAKHLPEEDALLIKSTLDRYNKFGNRAHEEALKMLAEKVKEILALEQPVTDNRRFLLNVLNDYVVLTR